MLVQFVKISILVIYKPITFGQIYLGKMNILILENEVSGKQEFVGDSKATPQSITAILDDNISNYNKYINLKQLIQRR